MYLILFKCKVKKQLNHVGLAIIFTDLTYFSKNFQFLHAFFIDYNLLKKNQKL